MKIEEIKNCTDTQVYDLARNLRGHLSIKEDLDYHKDLLSNPKFRDKFSQDYINEWIRRLEKIK